MKKIDKHGYVRFTDDPTRTAWEHIRVAEEMLGRKLGRTEQVHHINGDKTDNRKENLMIMRSNADHRLIHSEIPCEVFKTSDGSHVVIQKQQLCPICNRLYVPKNHHHTYCSVECCLEHRVSNIPSPETLAQQVWKIPSSQLAKLYNVSGRMIGKWCAKLGIDKPPRGYWTKVQHGLVE